MDLLSIGIKELTQRIQQKKISVYETTDYFLKRIHKHKNINSYISLNEKALEEAKALDHEINKGKIDFKEKPLLGIPFAIKDQICTLGLKTTAGSKILENFIPPYDATLIQKLKEAGAIILGKTNQDEFAMGSSSETSYFGQVKNPWNTAYVPGGSSGGSAAAQSLGLTMGSLGTDTGGSIRQPASFCGVVGLKPTYGRVSRYGIIAYASSLDQAGPFANSVEDAALILEVISGFDEKDHTTVEKAVPSFSQKLNSDIKNFKIGVIDQYQKDELLDLDVKKTFDKAIQDLKKMGAEIIPISLPLLEQAVAMYYLIATSEASSNLSRYDGVKYGYRHQFESLSGIDLKDFYMKTRAEGFGSEVKRRILMGTYCLMSGYYDAYYKKACQVRRLLKNQFEEAFKKCDVILSPVSVSPPFLIGEKISDPLAMYLNDSLTVAPNLVGLPSLSLPYGMTDKSFLQDQLPIGVQLTATHFNEESLLNVAFALEQQSSVKGRRPHEC